MAIHQPVLYLVSYDIADPKRLGRIHRVLKKQGLPVQYSVFMVTMTTPRLNKLLDTVKKLIDDGEDDFRCYALPANIECKQLGSRLFPDDVMLFSHGLNQLVV